MDQKGRVLGVDCMMTVGESYGYAILGYHLDRGRTCTIAEMPACGTRPIS